ncbi:MAG: hypothetical protein KA717_24505 [Woronichinia naegeliana WA131]|uniref:Uncharacterized protein n=1 Tax=Woronichinia naegeliana WA131 TaxID=2824559 RepID=A0A977PUX7_9CYAN|nr:MAG: hypothetical protein KA717_24505 [Woronichinia naegeliana WA131]
MQLKTIILEELIVAESRRKAIAALNIPYTRSMASSSVIPRLRGISLISNG